MAGRATFGAGGGGTIGETEFEEATGVSLPEVSVTADAEGAGAEEAGAFGAGLATMTSVDAGAPEVVLGLLERVATSPSAAPTTTSPTAANATRVRVPRPPSCAGIRVETTPRAVCASPCK